MTSRFLLSILVVIGACTTDSQHTKNQSSSTFRSLSNQEHGIYFRNDVGFKDQLNIIEYLYFNNGGGVAIGDIDNDGLEDVLLTANQKPDQLYKNLGDLKFQNITATSGINNMSSWSSGVVIDDVNGDGWKDIYVCKVSPVSPEGTHNELYINQGDGTFKELAEDYNLAFSGYATQASFFDYDKDGDLDMYLLCHSVHSTNSYGDIKKREIRDNLSGDRLYENKLDEIGKFVEVTEESGIYSGAIGYGLGLVTSDINGDGWVDIYVGNDFHDNDYLYINNGDGTFTESIEDVMTHTSQFTMGVDAADVNGDGHMDIFTTDMMPYDAKIKMKSGGNDTEQILKIKRDFGYLTQYSRNMLQVNDGYGAYSEQANMTGVFATDWSWSVLLQDFDNSGTTDIFISNGIVNRPNDLDYIDYINTPENRQREGESDEAYDQRLIAQMPTLKLPNQLFYQERDMTFSQISNSDVGDSNYSNGAAYADLDKDGDLDIITNNVNGEISLLENKSEGHFVAVDVKNVPKNTNIIIKYGQHSQSKEYTTTRGFQSASSHFVHFGLGPYDGEVEIIANGNKVGLYPADEYVTLDGKHIEGTSKGIQKAPLAKPQMILSAHRENNYDDIDHEFLMPYKLSRRGPATIYKDFNNDDYPDIFIGSAYDEKISYYLGTSDGNFEEYQVEAFDFDARLEDMDAAAFDFNKDGYEDLYVVSGGNQYDQQEQMIQDRIYINDKEGGFYRLGISLPLTNGSTIAVADYDQDGHDDFFVGTQNIPGGFGVSPVSFIIKNVNGQRLEIAARLKPGMVTDAIWTDVNDDGQIDLVIVGEWMPLTVLSYQDSTFTNITDELALPEKRGLFQTVETGDFNGDGKLDFALGNVGQNTTLQLGEDDQISMYIADFDGNDYPEPLIFQGYFGNNIPFADKMSLKKQMPVISKLYPSYDKFARFTSIDPLVKKDQVLVEKHINTLSSILILSDESGYSSTELPREAQVSTINDFHYKDGRLYFVGNSKANSHAMGQQLGSRGGVLSDFSGNNFTTFESMNLPLGTVSKEIIGLDDGRLLVVSNDGEHYLYRRK